MTPQKGFTLIELMIVVAIIGILAAIAIPAYQLYIGRSEASTGLAAISPLKTGIEDIYVEGLGSSSVTFARLYTTATASPLGQISLGTWNVDGTGSLTFEFGVNGRSGSKTSGETIALNRNASGTWSCTTSLPPEVRPRGCQ